MKCKFCKQENIGYEVTLHIVSGWRKTIQAWLCYYCGKITVIDNTK